MEVKPPLEPAVARMAAFSMPLEDLMGSASFQAPNGCSVKVCSITGLRKLLLQTYFPVTLVKQRKGRRRERQGEERRGEARRGEERRGEARRGEVR